MPKYCRSILDPARPNTEIGRSKFASVASNVASNLVSLRSKL